MLRHIQVAGVSVFSLSSCEVKTRYLITLFILKIIFVRNQKQERRERIELKGERESVFISPMRSSQLKSH